jgi:hypothetical protein
MRQCNSALITHAKHTPMTTGIRESTSAELLLVPSSAADRAMVNMGVNARMTWWN